MKELIVRNEWMIYDKNIISMWKGYKMLYKHFECSINKHKEQNKNYQKLFLANQNTLKENVELKEQIERYANVTEESLKLIDKYKKEKDAYIKKLESQLREKQIEETKIVL